MAQPAVMTISLWSQAKPSQSLQLPPLERLTKPAVLNLFCAVDLQPITSRRFSDRSAACSSEQIPYPGVKNSHLGALLYVYILLHMTQQVQLICNKSRPYNPHTIII